MAGIAPFVLLLLSCLIQLCSCFAVGSFSKNLPALSQVTSRLTESTAADLPQLPSHVPAATLLCKDVSEEGNNIPEA